MAEKKQLAKAYEPGEVEDRIYQFWLDGNYFHAEVNPEKKPYTIVIPPPNITGQLHMGHALDETLQDILIRWRRMQGYETLWMPGTDHASIATEAKIVAAMAEEGLTKEDLGREGFLERAWKWKETYGGRIVQQLKKLGSSCDWERERFTLDEGCSKAVREVFVRLYEKGLIYRGERIINSNHIALHLRHHRCVALSGEKDALFVREDVGTCVIVRRNWFCKEAENDPTKTGFRKAQL